MNSLQRIFKGRWEVRRTIWPYKDGWGTYHPRSNTVCDSGLSKEEAKERCKELNKNWYSL